MGVRVPPPAPSPPPDDRTATARHAMQVTQISADGLKRAYRISVPAADIEDKVVARLTDLGREVAHPRLPRRQGAARHLAPALRRGGQGRNSAIGDRGCDRRARSMDEGIRPAMQPDDRGPRSSRDGKDLEYTLNAGADARDRAARPRGARAGAHGGRGRTRRGSRRRSAASPNGTGISARPSRRRGGRRTATSW